MRIEVLGCSGGAAPGCGLTTLLINGTVALDAGALAQVLTLERQLEVRSVVLTHGHADHILTLPFWLENVRAQGGGPVDVYASGPTIEGLRRHLFNDHVWPDFTRIPDRRNPALRFHELTAGEPREIDGVAFTPVVVDHTLPTFGFLLEQQHSAVLWSSDTGPTEALWELANRTAGLQAVCLETSFASAEQQVADRTGHLTPVSLAVEVDKLEADLPVLVHHLKPASAEAIKSELTSLGNSSLELLREGEIYSF